MRKSLCITSSPRELQQGLFGQAFYYLLQILPYLEQQSIFPAWEIATQHYGDEPDCITVPGVLDLAYIPVAGPYLRLSLEEMRRRHAHVLGNDWAALNHLWNAYFLIPDRVKQAAGEVLPSGRVLGIHYRGTDKQTSTWDSNPISPGDYLTLIKNFIKDQEPFDAVFAASDQFSFVDQLRDAVQIPVVTMGEVEFHMASVHSTTRAFKADRAMLDCLLFSRCNCVVETSSALPSFAKLLNPGLEIYRCAASKLFGKLYTNMPYFPVAHIPVIPLEDRESKAILAAAMENDWTFAPQASKYMQPFVATPRWKRNHKIFTAAENVGIDRIVGHILPGHV